MDFLPPGLVVDDVLMSLKDKQCFPGARDESVSLL